MRHWEATAYRPFARVVLVTEEDAREVAALDPSLHVVTIPNGVDADHFTPRDAPRGDGILFTGALDAPSNEQAALRLANRIMPLVRRELPDAHLTIAGRNPGPAVRALEHVVPDVPDLRPYLWGAAVYACPMVSGTGIKNKLLEAMAAGAPAVATLARRARASTPATSLVADSDAEFAAGLVALLADRQRAGKQAEAARAYVRARHDWDAVCRRLPRPLPRTSLPEHGDRRDERAIGRQRRPLDAAEPRAAAGAAARPLDHRRALPRADRDGPAELHRVRLDRARAGRHGGLPDRAEPLRRRAAGRPPRRAGALAVPLDAPRRVRSRRRSACVALVGGRAARRRPARGLDAGRAERRVRGPAGRADGAAGGRAALARGLAARARHRRRHGAR